MMALIGSAGLYISRDAVAVDIPVMILAVLACLPIFFSGHRISRAEGVLFLVYYGVYSMVLYTRNTSGSLLNRYQMEMGFLALAVVSVTFVIIVFRATRYHRHHRNEIGL